MFPNSELLENRQLLTAEPLLAGRGQDFVLLVNPADENAVRIANAYQALRNIPDRNIIFLATPDDAGFSYLTLQQEEIWQTYVTDLYAILQERDLTDSIDFIGDLGHAHSVSFDGGTQSLSYVLTQLKQYSQGMTPQLGQNVSSGLGMNWNNPDAFNVVHSTEISSVPYGGQTLQHRYFMGGMIGVTARLGNSVEQIIKGLQRSVAADGTHPAGTIYFEENDDRRSNIRETHWPAAQKLLRDRGISVLEESNTPGSTPLNRNKVRGAVVGDAEAVLPNGSVYLPGSWADNLTSYGGNFQPGQTKATEFIAAGAAASSGTVEEPYAIPERFPSAFIFTGIDKGLTLSEAYYQSVRDPDMLQFFGDMLAQPYGDIPRITYNAGPAEDSVITGNVSFNVSATLPANSTATGITSMELYIDGQLQDSHSGGSGVFTVNTTGLSDGMHEFRIIAIANNAAESEGIALRKLEVRNQNRGITAGQQEYTSSEDGLLPISLSATVGSSTPVRTELRHLGRSIASATGLTSQLVIDVTPLAFGENPLIPVVVFADGSEVQGREFIVDRRPVIFAGDTPAPTLNRVPGIYSEYFSGKGSSSIATSDFSGTADIVRTHSTLHLEDGMNFTEQLATDQIDHLAIRFTGKFAVRAEDAGEHHFHLINTNDSVKLTIDGHPVLAYDDLSYGHDRSDSSVGVFLGPGEHSFELLVANTGDGTDPGMDIDVRMRTPDGRTTKVDNTMIYTVSALPPVDEFDANGTSGSDAFVLTYSGNTPDSTVNVSVTSGGSTAQDLGTFPLSTTLTLNGFAGTDSVRIVGSNVNDKLEVSSAGLLINGSRVVLQSIESRTLAAGNGSDTYKFDADTHLGSYTLFETGLGLDTIDFGSTTALGVVFNLGTTVNQIVNQNLRLRLNSVSAFKNLTGGAGYDTLTGNSRPNRITGNAGGDRIDGASGSDVFVGGSGNDQYIFKADAVAGEVDLIIEPSDRESDTLDFSALSIPVKVNISMGVQQTVHTNRSLTLGSGLAVENVIGGSKDDRITGNSRSNRLSGNDGNDVISGWLGSDQLIGGPGDDTYLFGGATAGGEVDTIVETASLDSDTLDFSSRTGAVRLNLATGSQQIVHTDRSLILGSSLAIENVIGGSGNDSLSGNTRGNVLVGNGGNDTLIGNRGRDLLIGGTGLDTISGGDDEDILIAGRTTSDSNPANLAILLTGWQATTSYSARVGKLRAGVGSPRVSLIKKKTVVNDSGHDDQLSGGAGTDWFFKATDDVITDLVAGELIDLL